MLVGVPKEIKPSEFRVGLTPAAVGEYVAHGHEVLVETGAGAGIGADDAAYRAAGATIAASAAEVFARADMIVKVKEPQPERVGAASRRPDPLHLSPSRRRPGAGARPDGIRRHRGRL